MQPASEHHIPDGLLASITLLSEKPRHGATSRKSAPQSGIHEANSTAAIGLQFRCWEIASGTVDAPSNEHKNPFLCGSEAAGKISLAGGLSHIPGLGSGVGGFIVNAVGGNAFSGATDLIHSFATGEGGGHSVFYNMGQSVIAGPTQGFGAAFGGSIGKAIESSPWGADIVSVGLKALPVVGEYASGIGEAKLIYDGVTYFGATAGCALGIVH